MRRLCFVDGCDQIVHGQDRCRSHYHFAWASGEITRLPRPSLEERTRSFIPVGVDADECWPWQGRLSTYGYGQIQTYARSYEAHRLVYELLVGPIPDGLTIDHLCRNRACVNPAHLEPVTLAENIKRGNQFRNAQRTLCKRGHPLTQGASQRVCRICRAEHSRQRWQRQRRERAA